MGKSINGMISHGANMTADGSAKMALQTLLFAELRDASAKRDHRAKLISAAFVGVIIGVIIVALNCVIHFVPS